MNRTDRLLAIVLELQAKGRRRARDLAASFETSTRTIYRDIGALCEAGVPVVAVPGQGYSLLEGYFLPPLSFTTDEATMLLLGSDYVAQNVDAHYRAAAQAAGRKIEAVLPERLREDVRYLQSSIGFVTIGGPTDTAVPHLLAQLRRAVIERKTVRFRYHTRHVGDDRDARSEQHEREADPYGLAHVAGAWYLVAHSHERAALRHFRLDRIDHLVVGSRTFTRPADFAMRDEGPDRGGERTVVVRALFADEVARWVRESRYFYVEREEDTAAGMLVTLRARRESEVLQWLLSWGRQVRVLEPESLRRRIATEAEGLLRHHAQVGSEAAESLLT